jgi:hypothetical protein
MLIGPNVRHVGARSVLRRGGSPTNVHSVAVERVALPAPTERGWVAWRRVASIVAFASRRLVGVRAGASQSDRAAGGRLSVVGGFKSPTRRSPRPQVVRPHDAREAAPAKGPPKQRACRVAVRLAHQRPSDRQRRARAGTLRLCMHWVAVLLGVRRDPGDQVSESGRPARGNDAQTIRAYADNICRSTRTRIPAKPEDRTPSTTRAARRGARLMAPFRAFS